MKTKIKLQTRVCECDSCKISREITRIGKLLPEKDAVILDGIFNTMIESESALELDLRFAESRIVDIYIAACRAHNKYDPKDTKDKLCADAAARRTKINY